MKHFLFLFFLFSTHAHALEAVVTVLETPLLKYKSRNAPVLQYVRKGDVIKIHPSVANDPKYDQYAPSPEKLAQLKKKLQDTPEYKEDELFQGVEGNTFYLEDEFIPTLDRSGNMAYILSDHIFVYFNDSREFTQTISSNDPTDYRLEEPLPRNYPLKVPSGYRGQFLFGLTQPYYESYPYSQSIKRKGYTSPTEVNLTFLRQAPGNYHERLFIGATISFRSFTNSYNFEDRRFSEERALKFGVGPTISYDAFKGDKDRINLSGTVTVNVFDRFYISQSLDETKDSRIYTGYSITPKLNLQYHRKKIMEGLDLDFVLGTSLEIGLATSYKAINGGSQEGWWQDLGADKFTTPTTFTVGGFMGLQQAY